MAKTQLSFSTRSSKLQRLISEPILSLADTARVVSDQKNYSVRAVKRTQDEVGFLIDQFNEMLAQIQKREEALEAGRRALEGARECLRLRAGARW